MSAVEVPVATTQVRQSSATPLGLAAFALNLFLLALAYTGLLPASLAPLFVFPAIFYGAGEFIAGFFEYRIGNSYTGLVFVSFGAFWLATGFIVLLQLMKIINFGADVGTAFGIYLIAWTIFVAYLWIGSFFVNRTAAVIFTVLMAVLITFILGFFGVITVKIGAWLGVLDALLAWYMSAVMMLNEMTAGRINIPL
jgi:succinate-acetate transporter protein